MGDCRSPLELSTKTTTRLYWEDSRASVFWRTLPTRLIGALPISEALLPLPNIEWKRNKMAEGKDTQTEIRALFVSLSHIFLSSIPRFIVNEGKVKSSRKSHTHWDAANAKNTDSNHATQIQYWSLLNWLNFRFRCGSVAVAVNWLFVFISSIFPMFLNVVHSLEPGETPSYSASHQAPNYVQRS